MVFRSLLVLKVIVWVVTVQFKTKLVFMSPLGDFSTPSTMYFSDVSTMVTPPPL